VCGKVEEASGRREAKRTARKKNARRGGATRPNDDDDEPICYVLGLGAHPAGRCARRAGGQEAGLNKSHGCSEKRRREGVA